MTPIEVVERRILEAADNYARIEAEIHDYTGADGNSLEPTYRQTKIDALHRDGWTWLNRLKDDALLLRDMKGAK